MNSQQFTQAVKKDVINRFKMDSIGFSKKADDILQDQIEAMNIPDTGLTAIKSFQKTIINLNSVILAIFQFQTRGVEYAEYVYNGEGPNRKFGKREYLKFSAQALLDYAINRTYKLKYMMGGKTKGERIYARRS